VREKVGATAPTPVVINGSAGDDPRALARDGLLGLGYTPVEADELLDGAQGERPEDLIAHALRTARRCARCGRLETTVRRGSRIPRRCPTRISIAPCGP